MWHFGEALKRSKSLRAIHLSGNPGITIELVEHLVKRIHGINCADVNHIDFTEMPSNSVYQGTSSQRSMSTNRTINAKNERLNEAAHL